MDIGWEEVERMAQAASAADAVAADEEPTEEQIDRWCRLFHYKRVEAEQLIAAQRSDLTRTRITDDHWSLVREEREAAGHDRETYEHSLQLHNVLNSQSAVIPSAEENGKSMVILRLGGVLDSAEKVKDILNDGEDGEGELPKVLEGRSEIGKAKFCVVSEEDKKKIDVWLSQSQVAMKTDG